MSEAEQALWARLASTVTPLEPERARWAATHEPLPAPGARPPGKPKGRIPPLRAPPTRPSPPPPALTASTLDSHWEGRLRAAALAPDFTLDLHGATLHQAHHRLDAGLLQAKAKGARLVLVITGKPRSVAPADRGSQRGAIRAEILDWLAAGPHAADIAAVRPAQRRHGGAGALYLVMRRR